MITHFVILLSEVPCFPTARWPGVLIWALRLLPQVPAFCWRWGCGSSPSPRVRTSGCLPRFYVQPRILPAWWSQAFFWFFFSLKYWNLDLELAVFYCFWQNNREVYSLRKICFLKGLEPLTTQEAPWGQGFCDFCPGVGLSHCCRNGRGIQPVFVEMTFQHSSYEGNTHSAGNSISWVN